MKWLLRLEVVAISRLGDVGWMPCFFALGKVIWRRNTWMWRYRRPLLFAFGSWGCASAKRTACGRERGRPLAVDNIVILS